MSLSDRLAAAAKERSGGTEVLTSGLRTPQVVPAREHTIIIGAHMPVATVKPDPAAEPDAICPTCGRTGELGVVDLPGRTSDWNCPGCGTMWRLTLPANEASYFH